MCRQSAVPAGFCAGWQLSSVFLPEAPRPKRANNYHTKLFAGLVRRLLDCNLLDETLNSAIGDLRLHESPNKNFQSLI